MARPHRRNPPRRQYGQRLLIVCEGQDECGYLCDALRSFGLSRSGVVIKANGGGSPEDVVNAAVAERSRFAADRGEARFDAVSRNPSSNLDELLTVMLHSRAGRLLR